ncbi:helix-turn-helix domain-containing protein [Candidatus Nitrospira bockiana]
MAALTWAFEQKLEPVQKLILLALADQADPWGRCYPGLPSVSERTGLAVETIRRHIARLRTQGLMRVIERRRADGSRTTNEYRLMLPHVEVTSPDPVGGAPLGEGGSGLISPPPPSVSGGGPPLPVEGAPPWERGPPYRTQR